MGEYRYSVTRCGAHVPEFQQVRPSGPKDVHAKDQENESRSSLEGRRVDGVVVSRADHDDCDAESGEGAKRANQQCDGAKHFTGADEVAEPCRQSELRKTAVHVRHAGELGDAGGADVQDDQRDCDPKRVVSGES